MIQRRILVVDDDPVNIKTFNEMLLQSTSAKFEILNANSGSLALKIARSILPDVIVADWQMPGMNGIELIKALKNDEETREIPVIMATGVMMNAVDLDIALAAGAVDYIRKPIDPVELRARLRSTLEMVDYIRELKVKNQIIVDQEKVLLQHNIDQLQKELDYRQKQLTSNISFLSQMAKEKESHIEILNKLRPFLNQEGKDRLSEILHTMRSSDQSTTLLELENSFDEINRAFFEKLEQVCPEITKSEKLLCAYSLLKLSPSEIAGITKKNLNSLNVGFSRLRSKFGVSTNAELLTTLENLVN